MTDTIKYCKDCINSSGLMGCKYSNCIETNVFNTITGEMDIVRDWRVDENLSNIVLDWLNEQKIDFNTIEQIRLEHDLCVIKYTKLGFASSILKKKTYVEEFHKLLNKNNECQYYKKDYSTQIILCTMISLITAFIIASILC
jgi:hypothetical protein